MSVKLLISTFGHFDEEYFDSIKSAAEHACYGVDSNSFAPVKILDGHSVVWENNGPFDDSYENLYEIAGRDW